MSVPLPSDKTTALSNLGEPPKKKGPPPIHSWHPTHIGESEMRIARDGSWFYRESPIRRPALVKLFSQLLRREGEEYYLVTPQEKLRIDVEDAPFVAVDLEVENEEGRQALRFVTQVGDEVVADSDHPIKIEPGKIEPGKIEPGKIGPGPRPYILVRDRLWALIGRPAYYRMAGLSKREFIATDASRPARTGQTCRYSIHSRGQQFILATEEEDRT